MDLKQQYLDEVHQIKQERIKRIIEIAKIEFDKNGITNTKISTIAKEAKVGEASIYRYFTDKTRLIELVAMNYWKEHTEFFDKYLDENIDVNSNGLCKVKVYLDIFIDLYYNHKAFLKFTEDYDNYNIKPKTIDRENKFFEYVISVKKKFVVLFDEGIEDGSIDPDFDKNIAYSFLSQVMVSATQKMALRLGYSHAGNTEYAVNCLNATIDMFIKYIANKEAN